MLTRSGRMPALLDDCEDSTRPSWSSYVRGMEQPSLFPESLLPAADEEVVEVLRDAIVRGSGLSRLADLYGFSYSKVRKATWLRPERRRSPPFMRISVPPFGL